MRAKRTPDEQKHAAILKAAMALFLENGYSNTSMDAIADRARVTKQTVYAHCQNKSALFAAIVTALAKKHSPSSNVPLAKRASGKRVGHKPATVEFRLFEIGSAFLNMVTSKEGLAATRLVVAEAHRHPKLAQHYYESASKLMLNVLADYLESENRADTLHIAVPLSAASYFFSILKGNYYLRILLNIKPYPSPGAKETHIKECVGIFMRVYGGKASLRTKNIL